MPTKIETNWTDFDQWNGIKFAWEIWYRCNLRCGSVAQYAPQGHEQPMGNIFDPDFRFWDRPMPCPLERCHCGESRYLWEGYTVKHPDKRVKITS